MQFPNYVKQLAGTMCLIFGEPFMYRYFNFKTKSLKRWGHSGGNRHLGGGKKIQNLELERRVHELVSEI